jgi:hypothetical protein
MQKESAFALRQDDFRRPNVFHRADCDLDHVARPKGGQHALAANAETQVAGLTQSAGG